VAFTGLALAACGGLGAAKTAATGSTGLTAGGTIVGGKVSSVSGARLVLAGQNGSVTVSYDSSTRIQQTRAATVSDVTPGTCVNASGLDDGSGGLTVVTLSITPATNGSCTAPAGAGGGPGRTGGGNGRPGGFGGNGGQGGFGASGMSFVRGTVTSVSGSNVTVQPTTGSAVTLDVLSNARIMKMGTVSASALAVGQCVTAAGAADSSGAVKARTLSITPPAANGTCITPSGRGRPSPATTSA
jgi:hypothetical protein